MEPKTHFIVSPAPHIKAEEDTGAIMRWVCVALAPAFGVAFYNFGWYCLLVTALCIAACVLTEAACQMVRGKPVTVNDFSAVLTGLLLAAVIPPNVSWWVPVVGGVFAIGVVKQAFGGLGNNIWNPALMARAFLQVAVPTQISSPTWAWMRDRGLGVMEVVRHRLGYTLEGTFTELNKIATEQPNFPSTILSPRQAGPDIHSGATMLQEIGDMTVAKAAAADPVTVIGQFGETKYWGMVYDSFVGLEGGSIAETSAIALLIGGLFLIGKKIIGWEIPAFYIATVALLTWVLPQPYHIAGETTTGYTAWCTGPVLLQLVSGGLMIGAFFMATDYVTSPITFKGRVVFAIGCGALTALIRMYSTAYPEGVCYSIILMNTLTPLIDAWMRPRKYGARPAAA